MKSMINRFKLPGRIRVDIWGTGFFQSGRMQKLGMEPLRIYMIMGKDGIRDELDELGERLDP